MKEHLFSRDEVLSGFPSRQAGFLLFLIESRTAQWVSQASLDMQPLVLPETEQDRDLEFLEAFSLGKDPPLKPTIQDIEHYATRWKSLAPDDPRLLAGVAHRMGQKYRLSKAHTPRIHSALALDDPQVQRAYQRQFQTPLDGLYAARLSLSEWLNWTWQRLRAWLEDLPAFWIAYFVTLTETIGASILALPIALAEIGPLPGIVLLVLLGLFNVITVEYMTETLARTGSVRFERAYLGRIVGEYLGREGDLIFSAILVLLQFLVLIAYAIGIATTLQGVTRIPASVWVIFCMLAALYFLAGRSMQATVSSALATGAVNILLILVLSFLALRHVQPAFLQAGGLTAGSLSLANPSILSLAFGTILASYFGHTATASVARTALRHDPSGKGLIWGAVGAQVTAILLYCLWTLAVNGSIDAARLAAQSGTVLIPLAAEAGPLILVLGTIFVVLGMGMGIIHFSRGCFNLVHERLPKPRHPVVSLPRQGGRLIFHPPGRPDGFPRLGLAYLRSEQGEARFRLDHQDGGRILSKEFPAGGRWEASFPGAAGNQKIQVQVEVLKTTPEMAQLKIGSNYTPVYQGEWVPPGLNLIDLHTLPGDQRLILQWLLRSGAANREAITAGTGLDPRRIQAGLQGLQEEGMIWVEEATDGPLFRSLLASRAGRHLPAEIWQALDHSRPEEAAGRRLALGLESGPSLERLASWLSQKAQSKQANFWISASPVILIFLFIEWLVLAQRESFAATISFAGVFTVSLLAGIFPALLLASSRRKGDLSLAGGWGIFGNPILLGLVYLVSFSTLLLHGLVIWQEPFQRAAAVGVAVLILAATVAMARQGAFRPRLVVQLRQGARRSQGRLTFTGGGKPFPVNAEIAGCPDFPAGDQASVDPAGLISHFDSVCSYRFHLGEHKFAELKIWAQRPTPEGDLESLPVVVKMQQGEATHQYDLRLTGGKTSIRLENGECVVDMVLSENERGGQNQA